MSLIMVSIMILLIGVLIVYLGIGSRGFKRFILVILGALITLFGALGVLSSFL